MVYPAKREENAGIPFQRIQSADSADGLVWKVCQETANPARSEGQTTAYTWRTGNVSDCLQHLIRADVGKFGTFSGFNGDVSSRDAPQDTSWWGQECLSQITNSNFTRRKTKDVLNERKHSREEPDEEQILRRTARQRKVIRDEQGYLEDDEIAIESGWTWRVVCLDYLQAHGIQDRWTSLSRYPATISSKANKGA